MTSSAPRRATRTGGNTSASMCECIRRPGREETWSQLGRLCLLILGFPVAAPQTQLVPNEPALKWMSVGNQLHTWQKRRDQREGDSDGINEADNGRSGARTGRARCTANGNRCQKQRFPGAHLLVQRMQKNNKNLIKTNYSQSVSQTIQK